MFHAGAETIILSSATICLPPFENPRGGGDAPPTSLTIAFPFRRGSPPLRGVSEREEDREGRGGG